MEQHTMSTSTINAPLTKRESDSFREALLEPHLADKFIDCMLGYAREHSESSEAVRRFAKNHHIEL
jgi:hypothetical protein